MKIFNKKQSGFTLVELVVVVAVVGVLAVVATPKIVGVATNARQASLEGVAAALTAASARNYATYGANSAKGHPVISCETALKSLDGNKLPDGYDLETKTAPTKYLKVSLEGGFKNDIQGDCTILTDSTPQLSTVAVIVGIGFEDTEFGSDAAANALAEDLEARKTKAYDDAFLAKDGDNDAKVAAGEAARAGITK